MRNFTLLAYLIIRETEPTVSTHRLEKIMSMSFHSFPHGHRSVIRRYLWKGGEGSVSVFITGECTSVVTPLRAGL